MHPNYVVKEFVIGVIGTTVVISAENLIVRNILGCMMPIEM
jgi:hypothetical protein